MPLIRLIWTLFQLNCLVLVLTHCNANKLTRLTTQFLHCQPFTHSLAIKLHYANRCCPPFNPSTRKLPLYIHIYTVAKIKLASYKTKQDSTFISQASDERRIYCVLLARSRKEINLLLAKNFLQDWR